MYIHEMTENECRRALQEAPVGRLACARENQPYVVPIYFALDREHLYAFTTLGQKVEWMRLNPRVCLEIDGWNRHDQWESVIVFGQYEELPDLPEFEAARAIALELLQTRAMWWEPAYLGAAHRDSPHSEEAIYFRIKIGRMTGHRSSPDLGELAVTDRNEIQVRDGWWSEMLRHIGLKD